MCYHRRLHFILCNHVYDLEIVRPCASAIHDSSSSSSSDVSLPPSTRPPRHHRPQMMVCRPMAHPWTTYKVRRVCGACAAARGRLDERVRAVREGVRGLLGRMGSESESEGDTGVSVSEEGREEGDGERDEGIEKDEDEVIGYIHPFIR